MEQVATQPAHATSAPPARATSAAIPKKIDLAALVADKATATNTGTPVQGFWSKTLDPTVFWNAASATATSLAIFAAFLVPWLAERRQQKVRNSYAVQMLPPVFDEAVQLAFDAERIYRMCLELMETIHIVKADEARGRRYVETYELGGINLARMDKSRQVAMIIRKESIDRLIRFSHSAFPAYRENRSWLAGLHPSVAGALQNSFSEAEKRLRDCQQVLESWPERRQDISPEDVRPLLGPVLRTREVGQLAARVLSRLLGKPLPDSIEEFEQGAY